MDAGYVPFLQDPSGSIVPEFLQSRDAFAEWLALGEAASTRTDAHDVVTAARYNIHAQCPGHRPTSVLMEDLCIDVPQVRPGAYNVFEAVAAPFRAAARAAAGGGRGQHRLVDRLNGKAEVGEMVLVLGPPGSGVSSLLRVLSGRREKGMRVSGSLRYNGAEHAHGAARPPPLKVAYVGEEDVHLPSLTVEKTFRVAAELSTEAGVPEREMRVRERVEAVLGILGLAKARDTVVGNALQRGVSGGERKRVSIGEALLSQGEILAFDGWSRGLDSATALRIGKLLRALTNLSGTPCVSSLYQAGPELYGLFDKVLVMRKGEQLFFGNPADAVQYTASLCIPVPPRKTVPDFLSSLAERQQQKRLLRRRQADAAGAEEAATAVAAESLDAADPQHSLPAAWRRSEFFERVRQEAAAYKAAYRFVREGGKKKTRAQKRRRVDEEKRGLLQDGDTAARDEDDEDDDVESPAAAAAFCGGGSLAASVRRNVASVYGDARDGSGPRKEAAPASEPLPVALRKRRLIATGYVHNVRWLLWREYHLTLANLRQYVAARMGRYLFQGLLLGALFFKLDENIFGAYNREGLLANAINTVGTGSFVLIPDILEQRGVFVRHKTGRLHHPSAWPLAKSLLDIPLNFLEMLFFVSVFYFMCSLNTHPMEKYVDAILFFFAFNMTMSNFIRFLVFLSKDLAAAQGLTGTVFIVFAFFNGFAIAYKSIPAWWKWAYYVSPFSYIYKAAALNEYFGLPIVCKDPTLEAFICKLMSGTEFLKATLDITGPESEKYVQLAILCGFNVACVLGCGLAASHLSFAPAPSVGTSKRPEDAVEDDDDEAVGSEETAEEKTTEEEGPKPLAPAAAAAAATAVGVSLTPEESADGTLVWRDVRYSVSRPRSLRERVRGVAAAGDKELLHGVSGYCRPGMLVALMGSTGAGKTTLLDVLAQRKTVGTTEGLVELGREPVTAEVIRERTGYVEQGDLHHPRATVREAIEFSATLRGGGGDAAGAAEAAIAALGLEADADAMVGSATSLIASGGVNLVSLKRVTIAVELVSNPSLLFLDEPTSGLDSAGALAVMRSIRGVADAGRAVVCTIHQPSAEIFGMFDHILLLDQGSVVYNGPTGAGSSEVLDYFSSHLTDRLGQLSDGPPSPAGLSEDALLLQTQVAGHLDHIAACGKKLRNPADVVMSIVNPAAAAAAGTRGKRGSGLLSPAAVTATESSEDAAEGAAVATAAAAAAAPLDWATVWAGSPEARAVAETVADAVGAGRGTVLNGSGLAVSIGGGQEEKRKGGKTRRRAKKQKGICEVFWAVLVRTCRIQLRSPTYIATKLLFTLAISILFGTTYWQIGGKGNEIRNYVTLVYVSGNMGLINAMSAVVPILEGRESFYREVMSGTYPSWVNAVAQAISEMPMILVTSLIWSNVLFWSAGFAPGAYLYFSYMYFALCAFMQFFGMALAAVVPTLFLAQLLMPLVNMLWALHSGFVILTRNIPNYLIEFHYANPLTYFLRSMVANIIDHTPAFNNVVTTFDDPTGTLCKRIPAPVCRVLPDDKCQCHFNFPLTDPTGGALCRLLPRYCTPDEAGDCVCRGVTEGELLLNFYGFSVSTKWTDLGVLLGAAGAALLFYILFVVKVRHLRR